MRKLAYIPTIIFTLCMLADMVSTVAVMSLPQTMGVGERHPWGYPGVLALLIVYPPIFFTISFGISKVKNDTLFLVLLAMLFGFLFQYSYDSLTAAASNLQVYEILKNGGGEKL